MHLPRFIENWLLPRSERPAGPAAMDREYVSEFTRFIDGYLARHPEVVDDQRDGWYIYWDHHFDVNAMEKAEKDVEPDTGYGYYASAWKHPVEKH